MKPQPKFKKATDNELRIAQGQIALLRAMLIAEEHTATIDDATADRSQEFIDGGKWRGSIPNGLQSKGLVVCINHRASSRPTRNATKVTVWRLVDLPRAVEEIERLQWWLDRQKRHAEFKAYMDELKKKRNPQPGATDAGNESHGGNQQCD